MSRTKIGWIVPCLTAAFGCGGGSSAGSAGACTPFEACGGDVVGVWQIEDICFENAEEELGKSFDQPECRTAFKNVETEASGTFEFTAQGVVRVESALTISMRLELSATCLKAIADGATVDASRACTAIEQNYAEDDSIESGTCAPQAGGCACELAFKPTLENSSDPYEISGTSFSDGGEQTPFCVEGKQLTLGILEADSGLRGQMVLSRK